VLGASAERIALELFNVLILSAETVANVAAGNSSGDRSVRAAQLLSIYPVYLHFKFSGYTDFLARMTGAAAADALTHFQIVRHGVAVPYWPIRGLHHHYRQRRGDILKIGPLSRRKKPSIHVLSDRRRRLHRIEYCCRAERSQ
jgi:hypothetical protein